MIHLMLYLCTVAYIILQVLFLFNTFDLDAPKHWIKYFIVFCRVFSVLVYGLAS